MGENGIRFPFLLLVLAAAVSAASAGSGNHNNPSNTSALLCSSSQLGFSSDRIPFDTSALYCNNVWRSQDFVLMYQRSRGGVWNFVLSAPDKNAYIAVGFSDNGKMVGSSSVVGWTTVAGTGTAKQYYLGGETPPTCPPDQGNLTLGRTLIVQQSERLYLAFELNVSGSEHPKNRLIFAIGPPGRTPGTNGLLAEHDDTIGTNIQYVIGRIESPVPSPPEPTFTIPMVPTSSGTPALAAALPSISASILVILINSFL